MEPPPTPISEYLLSGLLTRMSNGRSDCAALGPLGAEIAASDERIENATHRSGLIMLLDSNKNQ